MLQLTIPIFRREPPPAAQTLTWSDVQLGLRQAARLLHVIVPETKGKENTLTQHIHTRKQAHTHTHTHIQG